MGEKMKESMFPKVEKCTSVKIWSHEEMTDEMMLFGWSVFNQYQRGLVNGDASEQGCAYSNDFYSASALKRKSGMCSVLVRPVK